MVDAIIEVPKQSPAFQPPSFGSSCVSGLLIGLRWTFLKILKESPRDLRRE